MQATRGEHRIGSAVDEGLGEVIRRRRRRRSPRPARAPRRRSRAAGRGRIPRRCRRDPSRSAAPRRRRGRSSPRPPTRSRLARSGMLPASTNTSQPSLAARRFASIAITMHCVPNRSAHRCSNDGSRTAAEFTATLSAPARSSSWASSSRRTPPPDGERDEHLLGRARDHVERRGTALERGGDVEEDELVAAFPVVVRGELDRVAGVAQLLEAGALHHATRVDVEAGHDALREGHGRPLITWESFRLFSYSALPVTTASHPMSWRRQTSSASRTPPLAMTEVVGELEDRARRASCRDP